MMHEREEMKMDDEVETLEMFKLWCDEKLTSAVGLRRINLEQFGELVEKSYVKMQSINDDPNRLSYVCGIAAGMKMMLLPENEVKR